MTRNEAGDEARRSGKRRGAGGPARAGGDDGMGMVFKALADPTRRRILDLLKAQPRTTGYLCAQFDSLSRYAVMKHLSVLVAAGLVAVRRQGRDRYNHLNHLPLRRVYERWLGPYAELWSSALLRLTEHIEREHPEK